LLKRKAEITKTMEDSMGSIRGSLREMQDNAKKQMQVCTDIIDTATKVYPVLPGVAIQTLTTLKTIQVHEFTVSILHVEFSNGLIHDIEKHGMVANGLPPNQDKAIQNIKPNVVAPMLVGSSSNQNMRILSSTNSTSRLSRDVSFGDPRQSIPTITGSTIARVPKDPSIDSKFTSPYSIAYNPIDSSCYVADYCNHRIRKVSAQGEVTTFAGTGDPGWGDGHAPIAKFNYPNGVAIFNLTGAIYVCDSGNHRIRKITPTGDVSTVAGNGRAGHVDGPVTSASFTSPRALDVDQRDGSIYVADYGSNRIRKITPQGNVSTLPIYGLTININPVAIAFNSSTGYLYCSDNAQNRIVRIGPNGQASTIAGGDSGIIADEKFNPHDVKIDNRDGSLIVVDFAAYRILRITEQGVVSTIAGTGVGDYPVAIAIDQTKHTCFVADCNYSKIRKINIK